MRRLALGSVFALFLVTWGCATGGAGLSSRDLTASDLAGMEYATSPDEVERLRVLRPSEASSRFGRSGKMGAIAVELKKD